MLTQFTQPRVHRTSVLPRALPKVRRSRGMAATKSVAHVIGGLLCAMVVVQYLWASSVGHESTPSKFEEHVKKLKERLPNDSFQIVVQEPFVVIGDESIAQLQARSQQTIAWAVEHLKKRYFERDPEHIIDIWLFKDKQSYERHVEQLFGSKPHTPFGYYSSRHRALVMNISTGGGTLVHEIVHPFIEANFPNCPSWFNEGLASLYEQCAERNDQIWGLTNWRLSGLQRAIRLGNVPSFKTLCETTQHQFYREDPGTNYAQARYLCFYLQEQGKLREFYRRFRKNVAMDPSGYQTLQNVLEQSDMDEFQREWQEFVMTLRFP